MKCRPHQDLHTEECIKQRLNYCPECGGVFFAGAACVYEHRDNLCSMRWVNQAWVPADSPKAVNKQKVLDALNGGPK
jgi:hypothetical protein